MVLALNGLLCESSECKFGINHSNCGGWFLNRYRGCNSTYLRKDELGEDLQMRMREFDRLMFRLLIKDTAVLLNTKTRGNEMEWHVESKLKSVECMLKSIVVFITVLGRMTFNFFRIVT